MTCVPHLISVFLRKLKVQGDRSENAHNLPEDRAILVPAQIGKQIDASLKRLRTDYIDLYQCHRFDEDTSLEETMEALTEAVAM
jgi:aryl-alcohol dehydrogenase-like predicted oxidoreductase